MNRGQCSSPRSKSKREHRNGQNLRRDHSTSSVPGWPGGRSNRGEVISGAMANETPVLGRKNSLTEKPSSWTRRFAGFIQKKLSHPPYPGHALGSPSFAPDQNTVKAIPQGDFVRRYLNGERRSEQPEIISSPQGTGLPSIEIGVLSPTVIAADTGPGPGVTAVGFHLKNLSTNENDLEFIDGCESDEEVFVDAHSSLGRMSEAAPKEPRPEPVTPVAGVVDWNRAASFACGISTTLYECNPYTKHHAGDPIADAYAVVARENCAILALGDGVNWGEKASLASKCAVHGCIDYLNHAFFAFGNTQNITTTDVFRGLLRSFYAAHDLILVEGGMLTTLTVAMVLPTKNKDEYVVCSCNVGDSLAYVYSPKHGVRELTEGSHDLNAMRDMRDALGALGPVNGNTPELGNLTCAMTIAKKGDIVFITSDGVSDNFDPVVGKFAIARPPDKSSSSSASGSQKRDGKHGEGEGRRKHGSSKGNHEDNEADSGLPVLDAIHRHELTLLRMDDILRHGLSSADPGDTLEDGSPSAAMVCRNFIDFARGLTCARRRILEDPELYKNSVETGEGGDPDACRQEQRMRRKKVYEKLMQVPGKLDHASIVAYCVGYKPSAEAGSAPNQ